MKHHTLTNWTIYRWRYVLGYGALILLFIAVVTAAGVYAPGGLSQQEIDMIGVTNQVGLFKPATYAVTNLPFHLLQSLSFLLLGATIFSVKLPAIILSIAVAISLFFLLRRWFRPNVAILSMLIMVATGQLIFLSQSFTPGILYVLYTTLILLFASLVVQRAKYQQLWKISLGITLGLSMFTPYFWYINLGLLAVALIHPHPRHFLIGRRYRKSWIPAIIVSLVIFGAAVYLGITQPTFGRAAFGIESLNFDLLANATLLLHTYFWVMPVVSYGQIMPIMDFASLALIVFGLIRTIRERSTARSYMIWIWLLLAIPLLLVRPDLTAIITVPLFILLAIGIETLLREWYGLFPKNPYARGVGLVLMVGLISVMTLSGIDRYTHGYKHTPEAAAVFNTDLTLLNSMELTPRGESSALIIIDAHEEPLFRAYTKSVIKHSDLEFDTDRTQFPAPSSGSDKSTIIVSNAARARLQQPNASDWQLVSILTNDRSTDADRLYIYKAREK